jgi:hypothetical protein
MTNTRIDYSEQELYEITQLARLKFLVEKPAYRYLGEKVAKHVMTEDEWIIATMACLKYIDLELEFGEEGKFKINGKMGLVSEEEFVLPLYQEVSSFSEGFARVKQGDKWNHINAKGELLGNKWWDDVGFLRYGFAWVQREDGKYNHINTKGELISKEWQHYVGSFYKGFACVKRAEDDKCNAINTKGEIISKKWWTYIGLFDNGEEGFAYVQREDRKYNHINKKGELVSKEWYDCVWIFRGEGFAMVMIKDKGFNHINTKGELLSKEWWASAREFEYGFAFVRRGDGKEGYIDREGNWYDERP